MSRIGNVGSVSGCVLGGVGERMVRRATVSQGFQARKSLRWSNARCPLGSMQIKMGYCLRPAAISAGVSWDKDFKLQASEAATRLVDPSSHHIGSRAEYGSRSVGGVCQKSAPKRKKSVARYACVRAGAGL